MVVLSKQIFNDVVRDQTCRQIFHPWSKTCVGALPRAFVDGCTGSFRFYAVVYLAQLAMQRKNLRSKKMWIRMGEYFFRSWLLGFSVAFTFISINCLLRNLLCLRINYTTSLFVPLTLTGLTIYLEPPSRRGLIINLFVNQLAEYYLRMLSKANYLDITKTKQILTFMVGSSLLFYLMRLEGDKEKRTSFFWLYTAEKVNKKPEDPSQICPHKGPCRKYIMKGYATYFGIGLAISLAKLVLPRIRSPVRALLSIRRKDFKTALFFGSYIGIYRAVMCYLCRETGKDSALYALPAGFLSGLSMVFSPSLGLSIASITGAMKLYTTILYEKKILPENVPLPEMLYCLCQGILFTARFVRPDTVPSYIKNLTDTVGSGHCGAVHGRVYELAQKAYSAAS